MRSALMGVAAVLCMMPSTVGGKSSLRRLQMDPYDYSSIPCTTDQPTETSYCNSLDGMEQNHCTCGTCDQNKQDGSCRHYSKSDCAGMQPMLQLMDPTATPADHFSCETLTCTACPYSQCKTHAQSGCMYDATLDALCQGVDPTDDASCNVASGNGMLKEDCEGTMRCDGGTLGGMLDRVACEADGGTWGAKRCQTGVQAKYAVWRYAEPSPSSDINAQLCGYNVEDPEASRGRINVDYIPSVTDASMKCICEPCYMTQTDYTNRNAQGGYSEYCGLNVCDAEGVIQWIPAAGQIPVQSKSAGKSECDDNPSCKTFKEFAELTGASPEILMAFGTVCGLLVLYCLINLACDKGNSKEYDSDHEDSSDDDDEEGND